MSTAQHTLTSADLKIGRVYCAKSRKLVGIFEPLINDRMILWMDRLGERVQYDSPTVAFGRKHPIVTTEQFLRWARADVTDLCPKGEWRSAAIAKATGSAPPARCESKKAGEYNALRCAYSAGHTGEHCYVVNDGSAS